MSGIENVLRKGGFGVIVPYVSDVLVISCSNGTSGLTDIHQVAGGATDFINA
jgi:hypothetical protein